MKKGAPLRYGAIAFGVAVLTCAGAAIATADEVDDDAVDVHVEIADDGEGVLALSVAQDSMNLEEVDSADPLVREFTGTLPTVTVTDTRSDLAADATWAVLGSASDFVNADDPTVTIGAEHLGWAPQLLDDYGPNIEAGQPVETVVDDQASPGLSTADTEILYINWDPADNEGLGPWSANADLSLKVLAGEVEPGSYTSVLTLSLFE